MAISQLPQLSCSSIVTLDLGGNPELDSKAVQKLACGSWPLLKSLPISGKFGLKLFVQVAASAWPLLETVHVTCSYSAPQVISFTDCWQNVRDLQIITRYPAGAASFNEQPLAGLIQANWPNLRSIDLSYSNLAGQGMMQLALGQWPLLSKLDVGHIRKLTPFVYASFASGSWPQLTYLSFAHHQMGDARAAKLVNANWPKLQTLDLRDNEISASGCACLFQGNWPDLQNLCIEEAEPECPCCMYKWRIRFFCPSCVVQRAEARRSVAFGSKLRK